MIFLKLVTVIKPIPSHVATHRLEHLIPVKTLTLSSSLVAGMLQESSGDRPLHYASIDSALWNFQDFRRCHLPNFRRAI
jgi:hypothetical protein